MQLWLAAMPGTPTSLRRLKQEDFKIKGKLGCISNFRCLSCVTETFLKEKKEEKIKGKLSILIVCRKFLKLHITALNN